MAEKILMNKNTLAALKRELAEYHNALPVFEMKEQQLKGLVQSIEEGIRVLRQEIRKTEEEVKEWIGLMAEDNPPLVQATQIDQVFTEKKEIAGVAVENFKDIAFKKYELDLLSTPLWTDAAIEAVIDQKTRWVILEIEERKLAVLQEELAEARRMKNALKEVFIPETQENIRKIEIYLGDVERLAIGCAKLVKKKKQEKTVGA
jgi:V/A-type H+-transporting ATPase subunit D